MGITRVPINTNFQLIQSTFDVNHTDFNSSNPLPGKHLFVEMPVRGVPSSMNPPTTIADEGALYVNDVGSAPAYACMFYQQESGGADPLRNQGAVIQMTSIKPNVVANNGYTFLPGGILIQWGSYTFPTSLGPNNFPIPFTTVFNMQVTVNTNKDYVGVQTLTNSNYTITTQNYRNGITIYWSAIGSYTS